MTPRVGMDGAVPLDPGGRGGELAALTRRVADLEHRLNVMKVIVGLILAVKVFLVVAILYVLVATGLFIHGGGLARTSARAADVARPV